MPAAIRSVFLIALPFLFYFLARTFGVRTAALVLLLGAVGNLILQAAKDRTLLTYALTTALLVVALNLLGLFLEREIYVRLIPLALGSNFFFLFFRSQFRDLTLVERMAGLRKDLSAEERAYCRRLNLVWCCVIAAVLALVVWAAFFASLQTWAMVTGGWTYVIMGIVFAVEYPVRKWKFDDYGPGLLDRVLKRILIPLKHRLG